jgi:hypothetical protein
VGRHDVILIRVEFTTPDAPGALRAAIDRCDELRLFRAIDGDVHYAYLSGLDAERDLATLRKRARVAINGVPRAPGHARQSAMVRGSRDAVELARAADLPEHAANDVPARMSGRLGLERRRESRQFDIAVGVAID